MTPPSLRTRPRMVAGAAGAVLLAVAVAAAVLHGCDPDRPQVPGRAPGRFATTGPPPPEPERVGVVEVDALVVVDFHGLGLPVSPLHGPRDRRGDLAAGFSRTATGAVLAAVHIGVRANPHWAPAVFTPTIRDQVVGPEAAALLLGNQHLYERLRVESGRAPGAMLPRPPLRIEAFRLEHFDPGMALVDVVSNEPNLAYGTVRAAVRYHLVWRGGDWRVVAPPGGDWSNVASRVFSLDGYTRFPSSLD